MPVNTPLITAKLKGDLISRRHPEYRRLKSHWDFLESTYRGGRDWFSDNIFQYYKERSVEHNARVKRAYRFNHTREVVNLITKYVFKGDIKRDENAPEPLQRFWERATRRGDNIDTLMRAASTYGSIYGQPYIVVDSTADANVTTRQDEKEADARVYAYLVRPQNVYDMSFDEAGELNWILIREDRRDDEDFFKSKFTVYDRYRLWTRTEWYLFETAQVSTGVTPKKLTLADSGNHDLGLVPVIPMPEFESEDLFAAPGLIEDIAYLDRSVANYLSNLDAIIQDQTFSQLAIPAQNILPGDEDFQQILEMGTKNVMVYDGEGGQGPHYISPDPKQAAVILMVITKIITEIYHSVGMAGERTKMDNAAGIDNSSGVAKAYDFDRMNTMLKSKADRLQTAETRLAKIVMKWHEQDYEQSPVIYPDEFNVRNLYDEFEIAERLALLAAPQELRQYQIGQMVDKLYPQLKEEIRKKIDADIAKWAEPIEMPLPGEAPKENQQGQNNKDVKEE